MAKPEQELRDAQRAADNNMRRNSGRDQASHERRVDTAQAEVKRGKR